MMIKKNVLISVLFAIAVVAFAGYYYHFKIDIKNDIPVITADTDSISVSIKDDEAVLLQGVSAHDDEDGDVTDSVIVEGISKFYKPGKSHVTYAAFDSFGNVAKYTRDIEYTDYESPKIKLKAPLRIKLSADIDLLQYIEVIDCIDGDISSNVKTILLSKTSLAVEGIHEVQFIVTNSMGDTAYLTVEVEITTDIISSPTIPEIHLTDYITYIKKGEKIKLLDYVDSITVRSIEYSLSQFGKNNIQIDGSVDRNKPGVYYITFTAATEDNYEGRTTLVVVVEK